MEVVAWDQKYEIGVEDIDLQHHYFLNLIGHIIEAIEQHAEKAYLEALIAELDAYAKFHFKSEERMMVYSNYPEYESHKSHHFDLIQRLSVEQYQLLNTPDSNGAEEVIHFLLDWFLEHTSKEDKRFGLYLQGHNAVKS